jgi:hypothetical protein
MYPLKYLMGRLLLIVMIPHWQVMLYTVYAKA